MACPVLLTVRIRPTRWAACAVPGQTLARGPARTQASCGIPHVACAITPSMRRQNFFGLRIRAAHGASEPSSGLDRPYPERYTASHMPFQKRLPLILTLGGCGQQGCSATAPKLSGYKVRGRDQQPEIGRQRTPRRRRWYRQGSAGRYLWQSDSGALLRADGGTQPDGTQRREVGEPADRACRRAVRRPGYRARLGLRIAVHHRHRPSHTRRPAHEANARC